MRTGGRRREGARALRSCPPLADRSGFRNSSLSQGASQETYLESTKNQLWNMDVQYMSNGTMMMSEIYVAVELVTLE